MEELKARLDAIKADMQQLEHATELIKRETNILEFFDRVNKEVV